MLTKIREKAQGAFAWAILILICVPFALWGIQNYLDVGKETPVASVGDKDFYQRDVNRAYEQYSQNLRGMGIDEQTLKQQALDKLIKDEVLLQYVRDQGLVVTDEIARDYIRSLPYFQVDGKFDEQRYKSLLSSQRISSVEFVNRIKNALIMDQFQRSIVDTAFATPYDIESFFKIQNQQRDVEYFSVPLPRLNEQPSDQEIEAYYQQNSDRYKTPEQVSVAYVELSLDELAKKVDVTDDKLKAYYEEQKAQYSTPERRRISHILFAINDKTDDKTALDKALKAKKELEQRDFAKLAEDLSDDKLTAKKGGDLGLFNPGTMEKNFDDAVSTLKQGQVSDPVKSSFGYHLIKVTELIPGETKPFESVKKELTEAYQKSQAENLFYEAGEKLAEMSYENPDNLDSAAGALKLNVNKTPLFTRENGEGIASDAKVREAAFSEEVLQGNNSTPIEIAPEHLVVLRVLEHKQAAVRDLNSVKQEVVAVLQAEKAKKADLEKAEKIKTRLQSGESVKSVAAQEKSEVKKITGLTRNSKDVPEQLSDAIFSAAKPVGNQPTVFLAPLPSGEQVVVSLSKVTPGVMSEEDKKQLDLAKKNIARAFGQTEFNAMLSSLEAEADIAVRKEAEAAKN
ncbi:MAG: SurA N-terminal domain-containing protein [Gammaproteobacteria bacterium]